MALVWDTNIAEVLLILFLAYDVMKHEFDIVKIEALWLSQIKIMGMYFTSEFSVLCNWSLRHMLDFKQ